MSTPSSAPPRRSARLSHGYSLAKPAIIDSASVVTESSSVASYDPEASLKASPVSKPSASKRKRAADEVTQPPLPHTSKRPRRGHSYPSHDTSNQLKKVSCSARPKASLSSRYFDDDKSDVVSTKISLDLSSQTELEPTRASSTKAKGKARRIEPTSSASEPQTDHNLPLAHGKRPSVRKSASTLSKPVHGLEETSESEAEIVRAVLELSKHSSKSKARESTSKPRSKVTAAISARPSRQSTSTITGNKDEDDIDFEADTRDAESTPLSSLDSESDGQYEESDSDDFKDVNTRPVTAVSRAARPRRRPRRPIRSKKFLSWWERNQIKLEKHHSELIGVWGDLSATVQPIEPTKAEQPDGLELTLLPFQLEGLDWMKKQEAGLWSGGILADEMGMGKTIQTIALILSDRVAGDGKQTLVIAPTVAILQWRNEIEKFAKQLTVNVWHGGNRSNAQNEMQDFDVVMTSFAVLESTFRRQHSGFQRKGQLMKEASLLHKIRWHRVILDEAHNIKDRSCNTAKGAFALTAKYRWCLSGTPLQNRVGELYSLVRFLGADPFSYYFCKLCSCKSLHWRFSNRSNCDDCGHSPMQHVCFWNNEILKPIQKDGASVVGSHGYAAFGKLKVLLDRLMLRRTKLERADDLGLPPRAVLVRRDYFTEEEEELYASLYSDVTRKFSTYADAGTVLNNYGNIFQLITRMRQMSNHPDLVLKSRAAQAAFKAADGPNAPIVDSSAISSIHTCRICLDEAEDAIISRCRHIFCRECIRQYLETATEQEPECPVCHLPITIDLSQDALESEETSSKARQGVLDRLDPGKWRTSTKIEALVEELSKLNQSDHTIKSLVFSQFTVFLDLIERRLQLAGFKLARLQGNMTPEARNRTIQYFMNNNDVQVFLVSLKAGGVALNLTEASRVFIMDPWWNPAVELQAMDRIHRLGQHRPVVVTRLIIQNSIESRIVELQKKKEDMTGAALGDDDQALGRLTPEDLSFLFTL